MKIKFLILVVFFFFSQKYLYAELPFYLDFKFILNESEAGKKAQVKLKKELSDGMSSLAKREISIQEEERKIIEQKKIISVEDYKKKVVNLRTKVASLQKDRSALIESVRKKRSKARSELLKNLNPLIKEYMKEKKIRLVMDKKSLILADENLDITVDIIKLLNTKLKTLKLN
jgi:outer membrane protein